MRTAGIFCIFALTAAVAAIAQAPSDTPETKRVGASGDPKQIVCVNQGEIGSRLARRRICRTRAEWDDIRSEERKQVEEVQNFKPTMCAPPRPAC
ncbi:MAG: hypothetical protein ACXWU2_03885 [Allosphingosinicella sp.]